MIRLPVAFAFLLGACGACGGATPLPKGPPPEYEDEPAAQMPDASPAAPTPSTTAADAGPRLPD